MFDSFFCNGVFLSQWCRRSWDYIVIVVLVFLAWKFFVPKGQRLEQFATNKHSPKNKP